MWVIPSGAESVWVTGWKSACRSVLAWVRASECQSATAKGRRSALSSVPAWGSVSDSVTERQTASGSASASALE